MKKIVYRNITFGRSLITTINNVKDEGIDDWIFINCHRYNGDHMLGHGIGEYEVYDINREVDENLDYMLKYHKSQIELHQKDIDKINAIIKEPVVEKFLYKKQIGILPTKEELLKYGWEEAKIDEAFKKINL